MITLHGGYDTVIVNFDCIVLTSAVGYSPSLDLRRLLADATGLPSSELLLRTLLLAIISQCGLSSICSVLISSTLPVPLFTPSCRYNMMTNLSQI